MPRQGAWDRRRGGGEDAEEVMAPAPSTYRPSLPLDEASVRHLATLPLVHHDPFDRMLVCQAMEYKLTIVTVDEVFQAYPASILGRT